EWMKGRFVLLFASKKEKNEEKSREKDQTTKTKVKQQPSEKLAPPPTWRGLTEEVDRKKTSARLPSLLARSSEFSPAQDIINQEIQNEIQRSIAFDEEKKAKAPKQTAMPSAVTLQKEKSDGSYQLPSSQLLHTAKKMDQTPLKKELEKKADLLEETLLSFGIEAKVGQIHTGPTITCFEVHPAIGVKVGRITALEHDIALNMEAKSLRIIAPIPGKAAVGIEVPNKNPEEVSFQELLTSYQSDTKKFRIPMLLGKAVNGDILMYDLAKMPHCIIAGATGSGKSVCINSIVMSILMTARPDEVRLLMIDPKKVELTPYTNLPHMLAPVITEPKAATAALQWLVREMEKRYELLKRTGQRNIDGFNNRKRDIEFEKALDIEIPEKLPYYVGIIDELADLMMVASSDIETPIARIAQMARAVGIHLILATQRPSREVITGLIKANFPARISFKVASRVNSQIVLDDIGGETLLGNGDMLFLAPGTSQLLRAQGVFVRDEEISHVIETISRQMVPQYIIPSFDRLPEGFDSSDGDDEPGDEFYDEAKGIVFATGNASTTFLQRKLK
ncbi:MAG TPA: DNA translocase FtsK, partial [Chlamydiales bacterium]|nr:DNA translocase FtsK [Chlamydiales bacterium]